MTEQERQDAAAKELIKSEKELLGMFAASLFGAGLLGGVAGHSIGYQAGLEDVKPVTTTVNGGQTIINNSTFEINSSD